MHQAKMLILNKLDLAYHIMNYIAFYFTKLLSVRMLCQDLYPVYKVRIMTIHIMNIRQSIDHGQKSSIAQP